MKRLTKKQVIQLHRLLINESGGSHGIRDEKLLESALNAPFQTFGGEELTKNTEEKAAKLGFYLVKNHPFVDGNKRIGVLVLLTYLEINGVIVSATDEELIQIGLGLADGSITDKELLRWIIKHS